MLALGKEAVGSSVSRVTTVSAVREASVLGSVVLIFKRNSVKTALSHRVAVSMCTRYLGKGAL